jgi:hypothetical protein
MSESEIIFTKTLELTKSNSITIQVSNFNWKDLLNIYKSSFSDKYTWIVKNNSIAFSYDLSVSLFEIIKSIWIDYELKEYGQIWRYKVYVSNYNWNNSFQIREWVESDTYTWYGKKWVSVAIEKLEDFKSNYEIVLNEFENYLTNWKNKPAVITKNTDDEIESYF